MTRGDVFGLLATGLVVLGIARLLTTVDLVRRVIALNIASGGVLMVLIVVAAHSDPPDPVPHALALTGIVITVSVTGLALVLVRRIESPGQGEQPDDEEIPPDADRDDGPHDEHIHAAGEQEAPDGGGDRGERESPDRGGDRGGREASNVRPPQRRRSQAGGT